MYKYVCVLCVYFTLYSFRVDGYRKQDLQDLKRKLFIDGEYDKSVRPIDNQSLAIKVSLLSYITLMSFIFMSMLSVMLQSQLRRFPKSRPADELFC